ncbi:MAG: NADH-quinone oxidoreductase subunit H [Candidatus Omnitrophica bacterium]|nr:NADH-quinone oxidoreductase subunit H [Candidatus Omnitrophota bacterium]
MDIFRFLIFPGFLFAALVGLIFTWVDRKVTARLQWRVGPPFLQPFYDFGKLLVKEITLPEKGERFSFLSAPFFGLLATVLVAFILGLTITVPTRGFVGDLIVILYLLVIPALAVIVGGFASANPLASVGASREMKLIMGYELPFILAILVPVIKSDFSIQLNQILFFQQQHGANIWSLSGFIAFLVCLLVVQAKLSFPPFDIAEAETELMAGPYIEYSGALLALYRLTRAMLLFLLPLFLTILFFGGVSLSGCLLLPSILKILLVLVLIILIKNTNPRLRIDQGLRFFWVNCTLLSVLAILLAYLGL